MNKLKKLSTSICGLLAFAGTVSAQQTNFKFKLGTGGAPAGYTLISAASVFNEDAGYGIDFGSTARAVSRDAKMTLKSSFLTADKPFFFSVNVPEGNYKVTVTLGDVKEKTETTVKAESRRLMLEKVATAPGEFVTKTFVVNIRKPNIGTGGKVSLKPRELGKLDWDNKLTLEFAGAHPCVEAIEITKADDQITVYLAGNSTVVDQDDEPWASWGQMIPRFFKPGVAIADHAESGLTLGSFMGSHRLDKVMSMIKPGDYLFVEFGHNDQKEKGANDGPYKSYTERLKAYINEARAKKAIPVIVTSTSRRAFNDSGKVVNTLGEYPAAARKVAQELNVPLIDINAMTADFYNALGVEKSKKAFVHYPANTYPGQDKLLEDNTHFNVYGAYEIAKCIIEGIRRNHLGLGKYLIDAPRFDPSHPDPVESFFLPPSPPSPVLQGTLVKPDGN
ncbi:rhamnogalacturonan acetylesterase [Mucilaginibacter paludis]|uniref:Lipolytic protein G-D-S-L family n=1 Tax=Mucilaginibacter paludis DSM 18603 TaxID=714943 RepID=H1YCQ0_9SPHI|nr:rhamnogalacturonan acetylesterase [Mucilaginibacter paludis]EHQ24237.1 lipolytic protein G-D-S-L family [Mucilaginibacter paludis DSM 18603]